MKHGQNKERLSEFVWGPGCCEQPTSQLVLRTQTPHQARDTIEKQSRDNLLVYAQIRMGNNLRDKSSDSRVVRCFHTHHDI